ncbi:MAG TPA: hypothetical protein VLG49_00210 [Rhabdochlamydiaceae bacterium]|nr:hypothetical protein [Rhabdochlamydiaceae bacterium]
MAAVSKVDSKCVFCAPLPGKPDPNKPWDPSSKETRPRVVQPGQKGDASWHYALQILRDEHRIGKHPTESQMKERDIEIKISNYRKIIKKIYETFQVRIEFAQEVFGNSGSCTKKKAREFSIVLANAPELDQKFKDICCATLKAFCEQEKYDDFSTYANEEFYQALMPVHEQLFKEFNVSSEEVQKGIPKGLNKTWEELSVTEKETQAQSVAFAVSYKAYNCKRSPWHPKQPIEALEKQLELHGRHLVLGKFGQLYYEAEDPPSELGKIKGRPVFGWKPNAKRNNRPNFHAVVIVDVKIKDEKSHIYFLDPLDSSDPKQISTQKIYAMSLDRLRSSIISLTGIQARTSDGKIVFESEEQGPNNYALYI